MRLAVHIRAEHKALFPALAGKPDLQACLSSLREDHDAFMAALARAVNALGAQPPDPAGARALLAGVLPRLAAHNRREEAEVYPLADGLAGEMREALLLAIRRELAALPARYGA